MYIYIYTYVPPYVYIFIFSLAHKESFCQVLLFFLGHNLIICRLHTTLPETNTPTEKNGGWNVIFFPFGSWPIWFWKKCLEDLVATESFATAPARVEWFLPEAEGNADARSDRSDRRIPPQDQWEGWRAMVVLDFEGKIGKWVEIIIWVDDRIESTFQDRQQIYKSVRARFFFPSWTLQKIAEHIKKGMDFWCAIDHGWFQNSTSWPGTVSVVTNLEEEIFQISPAHGTQPFAGSMMFNGHQTFDIHSLIIWIALLEHWW